MAEAPTGTGKTLAFLIPAICAFKEKKQRTIVTTETLALLDQIVDKDLPLLKSVYGDFEYFGLKGRNHYLCIGNAGRSHPIVQKVKERLENTNGERRDVEAILGYRTTDDEWATVSGETEFCSYNKCSAETCWSTRARAKAAAADLVITSHKMLQVHGEFIQQGTDGGLLGDFTHIIIDEAHSLEHVVVDGNTLEVSPYDLYVKLDRISKGVQSASKYIIEADALSRQTKAAIKIIQDFFEHRVGKDLSLFEWGRQSELLRTYNVMTSEPNYLSAMDLYENTLPDLLRDIVMGYTDLHKNLIESAVLADRKKGKINKGAGACMYLAKLMYLICASVQTQTGTVEAYGTTFAMFVDGVEGRDFKGREKADIRLRAVPMDVSQFLRRNLWNTSRSVTMTSATLRDHIDGTFRFLKRSLGLKSDAVELIVPSPFNFIEQQIVYTTTGNEVPIPIPGARYSMRELKALITASDGRSLVLFTSLAELEYAATYLRGDKDFPYTLLVQEKGADKTELAEKFKSDIHSVLLGSKTFFQGFDVQGESLTSLIMAKYSLPQYNATTKALISFWRDNGFPNWYTSKSAETFVQAFGRLIRSNGCRGVVALLDERVADPKNSIYKTVHQVVDNVYGDVEITNDLSRVKEWLDTNKG